jgi:hypothetical protein
VLSEISGVTSGLPDKLSQLEFKLDDLTQKAIVLKTLSLESATTVELTSRAIRHLLEGKVRPSVPRPLSQPEAPVLENPTALSLEELSVKGALADINPESSSSSDKSIFIPSALESSTIRVPISRSSSTASDSSSDCEHYSIGGTHAFHWEAEEEAARDKVLQRAAQAEDALELAYVDRGKSVFKEDDSPLNKTGLTDNEAGPSSSRTSSELVSVANETPSFQYDSAAAAAASRSACLLADKAEYWARFHLASSVLKAMSLRTRLSSLEQHQRTPPVGLHTTASELSSLRQDDSLISAHDNLLIVTPAMLTAARRGRFPSHMYGFAASGALLESVPPVDVALENAVALLESEPSVDVTLGETLASSLPSPESAPYGQATVALSVATEMAAQPYGAEVLEFVTLITQISL